MNYPYIRILFIEILCGTRACAFQARLLGVMDKDFRLILEVAGLSNLTLSATGAAFDTIFRVRMDGIKPQTTYYYTVDSTGADGKGDAVKSAVKHFTTP